MTHGTSAMPHGAAPHAHVDLGPVKPGLLAVDEASVDAYRREIVRLAGERNEARIERDRALSDWRHEVRILRAQLSEGTAPRVEALTRELTRLRHENDDLRRALRKARGQ